jgi:hypothetical protein
MHLKVESRRIKDLASVSQDHNMIMKKIIYSALALDSCEIS